VADAAVLSATGDSNAAEYRLTDAAEPHDLLRYYLLNPMTTAETPAISDADLLAEWNADRGTSPNRRDTLEQLAVIVTALRSRREERLNPQPLGLCRTCGVMARGEHRHGQRSTN